MRCLCYGETPYPKTVWDCGKNLGETPDYSTETLKRHFYLGDKVIRGGEREIFQVSWRLNVRVGLTVVVPWYPKGCLSFALGKKGDLRFLQTLLHVLCAGRLWFHSFKGFEFPLRAQPRRPRINLEKSPKFGSKLLIICVYQLLISTSYGTWWSSCQYNF